MQGGDKPAVITPQSNPQTSGVTPAPQAAVAPPSSPEQADNISWTASEFIAHTKSVGWYGVLAGSSIGVALIIYLLTKDKITTGMVIIAALLFGIMAARQPRELAYVLDGRGIKVGDKFYAYENFKSFSVVQEGAIESIWFMPMQRFMPGLSIYFAPDDGDKIVDALGDFLPFEPRSTDPIDKLMHRLRF